MDNPLSKGQGNNAEIKRKTLFSFKLSVTKNYAAADTGIIDNDD
jgi:hypothetical protein